MKIHRGKQSRAAARGLPTGPSAGTLALGAGDACPDSVAGVRADPGGRRDRGARSSTGPLPKRERASKQVCAAAAVARGTEVSQRCDRVAAEAGRRRPRPGPEAESRPPLGAAVWRCVQQPLSEEGGPDSSEPEVERSVEHLVDLLGLPRDLPLSNGEVPVRVAEITGPGPPSPAAGHPPSSS